jgi:hypothetical protein
MKHDNVTPTLYRIDRLAEEEKMTRRLYIPAAILLASFLGVSAANAQGTQRCYTVASLHGNYGVVATYGANVAVALGTRSYDGNGNVTGTFILNAPTTGSTTGARTIITGTQVGTYTVNCDGTGKITRTLTGSNGITTMQVDDFKITGAFAQSGVLLANSFTDAQETPAALIPGGLFVTRVQTRLPDFFE